MRIRLSDHFHYGKLLHFVLPSVIMMVFTSVYGVADGLFVSNLLGKTPFAAVNLIFPMLMVFGTMGFMLGTGGSAFVAKLLGQKKDQRANRSFSFLVWFTAGAGVVLAVVGILLLPTLATILGAEGEMHRYAVRYGRIILLALPAFMLQNLFQSFFVTAEKPKIGLYITVGAGLTNIFLDFLFIGVFSFGIEGAAAATATSQLFGGLFPLFYFTRKNDSLLKLERPRWETGVLGKCCWNGMSEMMTQISLSLVNILYNYRLLEYAGENGIAAYGVIMYVSFLFLSIFIGFSIGIAPVVGYHYGADNASELKNLYRKSLFLVLCGGVGMLLLSEGLATTLSGIFVGYDAVLYEMTLRAFRIFSVSYLFCGFGIFASAFFTALNNGTVSAILSFLRTFLYQVIPVFILPAFLGLDGIWLSVVVGDLVAMLTSFLFFMQQRKNYHYA